MKALIRGKTHRRRKCSTHAIRGKQRYSTAEEQPNTVYSSRAHPYADTQRTHTRRVLGQKTSSLGTEHKMKNNKNSINTKIYATDPLATFLKSSTDSATAPTGHQAPAHTATSGTLHAKFETQYTPPQGNPAPELMTQLLELEQT